MQSHFKTAGGQGGVQPLLSIHHIDGFNKRQEEEAIVELRKRAISRWLKQLPAPDEKAQQKTMWESCQSIRDMDNGTQAVPHTHGSYDWDIFLMDTRSGDTPLDGCEQKSMPSDHESPIHNLNSVKTLDYDRMMDRSPLERAAPGDGSIHDLKMQFSKKWMLPESLLRSGTMPDVPEQPSACQTSENCDTSGSDGGWSVMSDCVDAPSRNEDTAYGGSAYGAKKKKSDAFFHVKYKPARPVFSPPASQSIEPHSSATSRPFTPQDVKSNQEMGQAKTPEGEWWVPNIFFKGLIGMGFMPGAATESEAASETSTEEPAERSVMSERVLRRLAHRRERRKRRCIPRLPARARLRLRMQQAARRQKSKEIQCELEHPFGMKSMEPNGSRTPDPLTPPAVRVMDYLPPPSVTGLSDFDCYMGPMLSSRVNQEDSENPAVGHCQTWILEKLLCFLGGRTTHS